MLLRALTSKKKLAVSLTATKLCTIDQAGFSDWIVAA